MAMPRGVRSSSWPPEFVCPISRSVMADPVIVSSGQTYERRCIEAWMALGQSQCLKHSVPLDRNLIIPNAGLKAAIYSMAKSNGMSTLPLPPSPEHAYALARRLIQELTQHISGFQEPWSPDAEAGDESEFDERRDKYGRQVYAAADSEARDESGFDERRDKHGRQIYADNFCGEEDEKEEQEVEDGELYEGMESLNIETERRRSYAQKDSPTYTGERRGGYAQKETLANTGERRGHNYLKSSSLQAHAHMETLDIAVERKSHVKSSSTVPTLNGPMETSSASSSYGADMDQTRKARARANLGQDQSRRRGEHYRRGPREDISRYPRTDGSVTNPLRYSYSASNETLLESGRGTHELPPHLATKPSSFSVSEAPQPQPPPLSSSFSADSLVHRLRSEREDVQEAAVAELRQLTRSAENRLTLCQTETIQSLLPLFKSSNPNIQSNAVAALVNLSIEKPNKVVIVRAGAVRFLVDVLTSGFPEAQEHAAGAAFSLALADENKNPMGVLNAIPPLIQLIYRGPQGSRQDAAMAIYHLSLLQANKTKLVKVGAIPILLNMVQSKEKPDMAGRALLILSNVASIPEGRAALLQLNAIPILVKLLAIPGNKSASAIPEQAAAALVLLSKGNLRFRGMASSAGAQELLTVLAENGTTRAREKAAALLAIMKESTPGPDELDTESVLSRQYLRMKADGGQMNSSAF